MKNLLTAILPTRALGIEIAEWSGEQVVLTAPLEPNLNDKGTAFAGSIDSMLDLAGWSAITLALRDAEIDAEVMVVKSETKYASAVRNNMTATAEVSAGEMERIIAELKARGRSRMLLHSQLISDGSVHAAMKAHYAIFAKT